jgi:hypothetical protein
MAPHLSMPFAVRLQVAARDIDTAKRVLKAIKSGGVEAMDLFGGKAEAK